jgi:hypothetical protein
LEEFAGRSNNKLSNGEAWNIKIGKRIVRYAAQRSKYFFRTERPEVIFAMFCSCPAWGEQNGSSGNECCQNPRAVRLLQGINCGFSCFIKRPGHMIAVSRLFFAEKYVILKPYSTCFLMDTAVGRRELSCFVYFLWRMRASSGRLCGTRSLGNNTATSSLERPETARWLCR